MRGLLAPLTPLYRAGLAWKNRRFDQGKIPVRRLASPVISIGSLSAGGAGKTPVVMAMAELLREHGIMTDILTRGYGRQSTAVIEVDPAGDAATCGDEALLMARRGYRVFVGSERFEAGTLAEQANPGAVHLLDDGMQHRRLHRDFEIALLTQADVEDRLLPAGNLREPLEELRRADAVVVRLEELPGLGETIRRYAPQAKLWPISRCLRFRGAVPRRAFAFCGIARPEGFLVMVAKAGVEIAARRVFADHHPYTQQELREMVREAARLGCDGIVTTEKDAVKLSIEIPNLAVAALDVAWADRQAVWSGVQETLVRRAHTAKEIRF